MDLRRDMLRELRCKKGVSLLAGKFLRVGWASPTSLVMHLFWAVLTGYIFWASPDTSTKPVRDDRAQIAAEDLRFGLARFATESPPCFLCAEVERKSKDAQDAIASAAEMGRLDFVAMCLTFLGVVLAMGAIMGFFVVRYSAMDAARDEVKIIAEKLVTAELAKHFDGRGVELIAKVFQERPELLYGAVDDAIRATKFAGGVSDEDADKIAEAFSAEDGEDE
jgi:hypothetical protein